MRILDSIRGHFALLANRELHTLSEKAPFVVTRVVSTTKTQSDWTVEIRPLNGKSNLIYISDILKVYAWIMHNKMSGWVTRKDIQGVIEESRINKKQASYILALMATFDDFKPREGNEAAIKYISHKEKFGSPVK
ncbi:MAG: hypothetical protein ABI904_01635 [Chloroflexota bacterium]